MSQHHDIDPSLRAAEPAPARLDDGFSPAVDAQPEPASDASCNLSPPPALGLKSPF